MIVVDASVLANVVGDDGPDGSTARAFVGADEMAIPDLANVETLAVLRRRWLAGTLTTDRFKAAVDDLADLPVRRWPSLPLLRRAFDLRANVTPYDAVYVVLAEGLDCDLVTADQRLARAPGLRCSVVVLTTPTDS